MSTFETLHKKMRVKDSIIAKQSQDLAALQAQLDEARRNLGDLQGGHELTVQELHAVGRERDEAREWCQRLQRDTQTLTCIYCGKEYPPGSPTHGAAVLTEHIRVCEKHPMRALEADLVAAKAEIVALREVAELFKGCVAFMCLSDGESDSMAKGRAILARTASYEGLVVVPKAMAAQFKTYGDNLEALFRDQTLISRADLAAQSAKLSEAEKRLDYVLANYVNAHAVKGHTLTRSAIDAAIAKGGSATTEPIGSPEHCERMAKFLADHKDPELWGAVGALNWAAKHIRELTS